jgi:ABC-type glycerol-3-phosphate transport system permease component
MVSAIASKRNRRSTNLSMIALYFILAIGIIIALLPFYWMFTSSFKTSGDIWVYPPELIPKSPTLLNYVNLLTQSLFPRHFLNSTVVAICYTVLSLFFASLGGFTFAKYSFPGRDFLFIALLGTMMIPTEVTLVPLFVVMSRIGWVDSYASLIIPFSANAFGIFMMRQNMSNVPSELLDAGRIDGCREFQLYHKLALPVVKPGLSALAILNFLNSWNDFLWPLIILQDKKMFTVPLSIALMKGLDFADYGLIMAASSVATLPVMVVFWLMSEHFIAGALSGALKG